MRRQFLIFFSFFQIGLISAQRNNQNMKWFVTGQATRNFGSATTFNTYSLGVGANAVMLYKNDVYDSSPLYLDFALRADPPVKVYGDTKIHGIYGNLGIKNFLYLGNMKRRPFGQLGGGAALFKIDSKSDLEDQKLWRNLKMDYFIYGGVGYTLTQNMEVYLNYSWSINKVVPLNFQYGEYQRRQGISLGLNVYFLNNFWFAPVR